MKKSTNVCRNGVCELFEINWDKPLIDHLSQHLGSKPDEFDGIFEDRRNLTLGCSMVAVFKHVRATHTNLGYWLAKDTKHPPHWKSLGIFGNLFLEPAPEPLLLCWKTPSLRCWGKMSRCCVVVKHAGLAGEILAQVCEWFCTVQQPKTL